MQEGFLQLLKEALEIENREIDINDEFRDYDEWDSLAYLSIIAMYDEEFDIQIEEKEFNELRTVNDLFNATQK